MKNVLIVLFHFFFLFGSTAQVPDRAYTDCDGNTESIYQVIGQGKPLLVASKGLDCSICMSQANEVQEFAAMYPQIRVWGAMNYKYSPSQPDCTGSNNWRSTYSWNDIFMFLDLDDTWQRLSYPTYHVISPEDSTVVYEGPNFSLASAAALTLIPSALKPINDSGFQIQLEDNIIWLQCNSVKCRAFTSLELFNLFGQRILSSPLSYAEGQSGNVFLPQTISSGIYFVSLSDEKGIRFSKKIAVK